MFFWCQSHYFCNNVFCFVISDRLTVTITRGLWVGIFYGAIILCIYILIRSIFIWKSLSVNSTDKTNPLKSGRLTTNTECLTNRMETRMPYSVELYQSFYQPYSFTILSVCSVFATNHIPAAHNPIPSHLVHVVFKCQIYLHCNLWILSFLKSQVICF